MRASGSSTTFGRSPCAKARAVAQFHSEPRLDGGRAVQSHHIGKPLFEKLTRPPGGGLANLSFGPFRLVPTQFLLLEDDEPASTFFASDEHGELRIAAVCAGGGRRRARFDPDSLRAGPGLRVARRERTER